MSFAPREESVAIAWLMITTVSTALALVASRLTFPLFFPRIERVVDHVRSSTSDTVVMAGSYNPAHKGHLSMLRCLSERHNKVYAAIGFNPDKVYEASPEERKAILERSLEAEDIRNVEVVLVEGYIWRFAMAKDCSCFYRGIRSWEQDGKEERHLHFLNQIGPIMYGPRWPVPTTFLLGDPKYSHISSTAVRECAKQGADISDFVPNIVEEDIRRIYGRKV